MKRIFKITGIILGLVLILFGIFLVYATINDYKPDEKVVIYKNESPDAFNDTSVLSLMIWNIGYTGLGADMDFFYDGGSKVRSSQEKSLENLNAVKKFIMSEDSVDFFLLQEVDVNSKRSYHVNQYDTLNLVYPEYSSNFALNYNVFYVPVPIQSPMGKVESGLMTISRYKVSESVRYAFPGNFEWPKGLFMLDRCFLVNRYPLENGKELIIINTHNSAYDDGRLRAEQMKYLKNFLEKEYKKGNYLIVGGDWNQAPPNFTPNFKDQKYDNKNNLAVPSDYLPKWTWLYDKSKPTNRRVKTIYKKGETPTALIDFFLISPNIEGLEVQTIDLNFKNSDHQPVKAFVKLKSK